jgi:hypothetical protein
MRHFGSHKYTVRQQEAAVDDIATVVQSMTQLYAANVHPDVTAVMMAKVFNKHGRVIRI